MNKEDFTTVYLQGRYDEKDKWRKLIKDKKERLKGNIDWINYNENMYAIKVLDELLEGRERKEEKGEERC